MPATGHVDCHLQRDANTFINSESLVPDVSSRLSLCCHSTWSEVPSPQDRTVLGDQEGPSLELLNYVSFTSHMERVKASSSHSTNSDLLCIPASLPHDPNGPTAVWGAGGYPQRTWTRALGTWGYSSEDKPAGTPMLSEPAASARGGGRQGAQTREPPSVTVPPPRESWACVPVTPTGRRRGSPRERDGPGMGP